MYQSVIGKKLVDLYNEENGTKETIETFWKSIYHPLFYDHSKYLLVGGNTPLENGPKISWKKREYPTKENRKERLKKILENINSSFHSTNNSLIAPSDDSEATTSGQVTSMQLKTSVDEIYSSWIGVGLGIGLEGGYSVILDKPEALNFLYDGWFKYRDLVNQTDNLKGNQIETWNGNWLYFALNNKNYKKEVFIPHISSSKGESKLETLSWIKFIFCLAKKFPNEVLNAYVYSLGQMNTTIGFIKIHLPEIKREFEVYDSLFEDFDAKIKPAIDEVYNTEYGFKTACKHGTIGLKEIKPKNIEKYKPSKKQDYDSLIKYKIYLSWLIAMINNENTIKLADAVATYLVDYEITDKRAKTTKANNVQELLGATTKTKFLNSLAVIIKNETDQSHNEFINSLTNEIVNLQNDKFPYLLSIIKIKHAYMFNKQNQGASNE